MSSTSLMPRGRAWLAALALMAAPWLATSALAQDDPPGRIARLAATQGAVSWYDHEQGQWTEAERNRPLTSGDRLSTGAAATAELRVGSTVLRLSEACEIELMRIDDERIVLQLHRGSLALNVRAREVAVEIDLVTAEAMLRPLRSGLYRLDRIDDTTHATALRGALRVDERDGFTVEAGQRVELWREGAGMLRSRFGSPANDAFAAWIVGEDRREERSASSRYVSPEMTGAEELDRNGRWEQHPDYGAVWVPLAVSADWAPYRYGRWAWVQPWGWTWVDDARWGFAPFHYGRWVHWRGRWGWSPGQYVARPVYAPALVAWIGGPRPGISINVGGPAVSWVALAPREVFQPYYRATPRYEDRVNHRPHQAVDRPGRPPQPLPTAPITYSNIGAPGAVTSVPREVMVHRQPVARAVIDNRDVMRGGTPLLHAAPPLVNVAPPQRELVAPEPVQPPREPRSAPVVVAPAVQPLPASAATAPAPRNRPGEMDRGRGPERDHDRDRQRATAPVPQPAAPREATPPRPASAPTPPAAPVVVQQPAPPPHREPVKEPAKEPARQPAQQPAPVAASPAAAPHQRAPEAERRREHEEPRKGENLR